MNMQGYQHREYCAYRQGRTSCWVLGGLGCLGLLILAAVFIYLLGRTVQKTFGETIKQAAQIEQVVEPRLKAIYRAIQRYAADHNGKYPPSLQVLVPKYLSKEMLQPVAIDEKTQVKIIYKPPKPTDPDDTIILEHQPPITMKMSMFGETVETHITLQIQKDGRVSQMQETISSKGERRVRQRVRPAGP
ncbi:hypothetical protein HRbin15_01664 [bacterium HR15]|nr:hypothetical protein HRbin15_01664 [bacterium HR15]